MQLYAKQERTAPSHQGPRRSAPGPDGDRIAALQKAADASAPVSALENLKGLEGSRAAGIVQRYPASNGTAGAYRLPVGTLLTHGTPVAALADRNAPVALNAPAWLAMGSRFSVHAGARDGGDAVYLLNFEVTKAMYLLAFADVEDISLYLQAKGGQPADENGTIEANLILGLNPGVMGYYVASDAVRGEPEIVLFADGLANLQRRFVTELEAEPLPEDHGNDDLYADPKMRPRRKIKGGGQVLHTADVDDLTDFRTVGDHPVTGRARAQSF